MLSKRGERRSDACDVVVVGAGLVGAAVAARLTREGLDTVILEAGRVAAGATGRSAGMVLAGLPGHYSWAVSVYGRRSAHHLWALTAGGRDRLLQAADRLGVSVERTGSMALAVDEEEADMLWESARLLREDGFDASFSLTDPLDRGFQGVLRRRGDAVVDASTLTQALLALDGIVVHEGAEVHAVEPVADGFRVWSPRRTVLCSAVVMGVNGYAALAHPYLSQNVRPAVGHVCSVEMADDVLPREPCTFAHGSAFLRALPGGRALIGGWSRQWPSAHRGCPSDRVVELASRHFPEVRLTSLDCSSGLVGLTPDGLPLLGALPGLPHVYFAVGFGGRGLCWAFVAAERLAEAMLDDADFGLLSAQRLEDRGSHMP